MNRRQLLKYASLLIGGMASGSIARTLLAAETTGRVPAQPVFDSTQRLQVASIAELIIPTTDTPGAIAAGVPDFIEMMVAEWYTDTERQIFVEGLAKLDSWCQQSIGTEFLQASAAQQTEALRMAEQQAANYRSGADGVLPRDQVDENTPFFVKAKELVVVGYYTSEVGARQEHKYFRMTQKKYDGDYDLAKVDGRQWAY